MCAIKLITAHRILIAAGIAFFQFYALVQARLFFARGGGTGALVQAVVAAAIVIGLVLYYRSLKQWGRKP
jgi:hypothetical protein